MKTKALMFTAAIAALTMASCATTSESVAQTSKAEESKALFQKMQMDNERLRVKEYQESTSRHYRENAVRYSAKSPPQP